MRAVQCRAVCREDLSEARSRETKDAVKKRREKKVEERRRGKFDALYFWMSNLFPKISIRTLGDDP